MHSVKIYLDNRESIKDKLSELIPNDAVFKNLLIGDYQYIVDNIIFLIIERKTITDYAASIKDHRNREQKKRLLANKGDAHILYLIEGDLTKNNDSYHFNKVDKNTIISSIINTITRDKINVFHTKDKNETIFFLKSIYDKLLKQGITFLDNKSNHSDDLINTKLLQNKSDNIDPKICFRMMLNCIPNVSNKISYRLSDKFNNINNMIVYIKNLNKENRIEYLTNLKMNDDKNSRKINKKSIKNIITYLGIVD